MVQAAHFSDIAEYIIPIGSTTKGSRCAGVADYSQAFTAIKTRHADEADTTGLQFSPGAIVLVTRAVNVDPVGAPVQYLQTHFAADQITLLIESGSAQKFRARV